LILADTSIWVDHLRVHDETLAGLLDRGMILSHPMVVGELALGNLRQRKIILDFVSKLPSADVASDAEVLHFVDRHALFGRGIGYIDAHLLASAQLTAEGTIWTRDKRLHVAADQLGLASTR
jgi:predicted nucleic acid-binding protein